MNNTLLTQLEPVVFDNSTMTLTGFINGTTPITMQITGNVSVVSHQVGTDLFFTMQFIQTLCLLGLFCYCVKDHVIKPKDKKK